MIERGDLISVLLQEVPQLREEWARYLSDSGADIDGTYVQLAWFANAMVESAKAGRKEALAGIAVAIERLHVEGDAFVREAATIGLLEGIQNYAGDSDGLLPILVDSLGPESRRWWNSLNAFWDKKIPFVGADIVRGPG
jgi:hypothetical protein